MILQKVLGIKDLLMDIININKLNNITSKTHNVNKDINNLATRTRSEILFWN